MQLVTFGVIAVASTGVVMLVDRAASRLLPLAALLNLSIVFPDQAPSRYRVARSAAGVRSLEARLERARRLVRSHHRRPLVQAREERRGRQGGARALRGTDTRDIDDSVAFRGDRSLRVRPDAPRDRRYVETRVAIGDVVAGRSLRGARITCQLHPGAARDLAGVRAGLVVEDGTTGADFGAEVPLPLP